MTSLCGHPGDSQTFWAGVEIDGVYRTRDGGRTWVEACFPRKRGEEGLSSQDIHALIYVPGQPGRLIASTNNDVNISEDDGETWRRLELGKKMPVPYFRGMMQQAGKPNIILLGNGDAPPGMTGLIVRSLDGGLTWTPAEFPGRANSTIWNFAAHPADPSLVYASSVSGQVYRSRDGGASWTRLPREFGEIRALAWTP